MSVDWIITDEPASGTFYFSGTKLVARHQARFIAPLSHHLIRHAEKLREALVYASRHHGHHGSGRRLPGRTFARGRRRGARLLPFGAMARTHPTGSSRSGSLAPLG